jgi:hypothetical protein
MPVVQPSAQLKGAIARNPPPSSAIPCGPAPILFESAQDTLMKLAISLPTEAHTIA